jgi:hypothetical protein
MSDPSANEIAWRDYSLNADLYKFYLEIIIKVNVAYYAVTGGIVSFCLSQSQGNYIRFALLLPAFMAFCFAMIFGASIPSASVLCDDMRNLQSKLSPFLKTYHNLSPLIYTLTTFAAVQSLSCLGLVFLFWKLSTAAANSCASGLE